MKAVLGYIKRNFWPISSIAFGPWHAGLMLLMVGGLTKGTILGDYIEAHYTSLKSILVVTFSLYFMVAFMMWVVHRPKPEKKEVSGQRKEIIGLSLWQILGWGFLGILTVPLLMAVSVFSYRDYFTETLQYILSLDAAVNAGFVWLISIAALVMTPITVVWLAWMWLAWNRAEYSEGDMDNWSYEYEG
ncbi:MAG: hypothetical protein KDJ65_20365 [Anaerolineae bacterium]|nr:hypothetical protein [Anaerolineae bacterium]